MKIKNILEAKLEAKRFLERLEVVEKNQITTENINKETRSSKETGALKRASMDLTRSLAKMRNDTY